MEGPRLPVPYGEALLGEVNVCRRRGVRRTPRTATVLIDTIFLFNFFFYFFCGERKVQVEKRVGDWKTSKL